MEPNERHHVFLHREGSQEIAYQAGKVVAKRSEGGHEKFYADLHVWMRKTSYQGPIWRVTESGAIERAEDVERKAADAYR